MSKILVVLFLCCAAFPQSVTLLTSAPVEDGVLHLTPSFGSLQRAEQLTTEEKNQLTAAQAKVDSAVSELENTKRKVADAHHMKSEEYMEWRTWYEFDGDFVLFRFRSNFEGLRISPAVR
jgi:exonuclease VII small subunit